MLAVLILMDAKTGAGILYRAPLNHGRREMMICPKCGKEFEACYLCRGQYNHQQCVNDEMCHDCTMIDKEKHGYDFLIHSNPHGGTACGKAGRMHRMKRINWDITHCIYPDCDGRC